MPRSPTTSGQPPDQRNADKPVDRLLRYPGSRQKQEESLPRTRCKALEGVLRFDCLARNLLDNSEANAAYRDGNGRQCNRDHKHLGDAARGMVALADGPDNQQRLVVRDAPGERQAE